MHVTRRLFLVGSLTGLAACRGLPSGLSGSDKGRLVQLEPGTRLIMVRHADRDGSDLSAKGIARAKALPGALEGIQIDTIFSPGIQRNLDTAAPLAAARDMPVTRIPQERPAPIIARRSKGNSVIWVGNKGNLQSIWDDLGLSGVPPLEYGDLFIITADDRSTLSVERRRWGPE